jgi:riboflavin kinase/FMN adenylyltransferase
MWDTPTLFPEQLFTEKIGRTIGYPTANIETESIKLLPKKGAYIVEVFVKGQQYKGMLSVGTNPTVNGEN